MKYMAKSRLPLTPHSLRIVGHAFYSIQNMHGDFVQFSGRRSINRASQLYYRASAADNINRVRLFFKKYHPELYLVRVSMDQQTRIYNQTFH